MNLNFDDGRKEYTINGDENKKIRLNLGDPAILVRLDLFMKRIEDKKSEYEALAEKENKNDRETLTLFIADMDKFLREQIDLLLDWPVSDVVFGRTSPSTITSTGKMVYETFIESLMPELEKTVKKNAEAQAKRVNKYREQYHK